MARVRERSDLRRFGRAGQFMPQFAGAEMLSVSFLTDPKAVTAVLPRPVRAADEPLACAFVACCSKTNFGVTYNEGALFLAAEHPGERGWYCLSMPVDDDTAMIAGRGQFGFWKKMAEGSRSTGMVVRQIIAADYGVFDNTVLPGRVVRRIYNRWRFLPKRLFKNDAFALVDLASRL